MQYAFTVNKKHMRYFKAIVLLLYWCWETAKDFIYYWRLIRYWYFNFFIIQKIFATSRHFDYRFSYSHIPPKREDAGVSSEHSLQISFNEIPKSSSSELLDCFKQLTRIIQLGDLVFIDELNYTWVSGIHAWDTVDLLKLYRDK